MAEHTVVVVEDDANALEFFSAAIDACADLQVVGRADTLAAGLALLGGEAPDLLVVDLGLPDGNGIDLIRAARRLSADTQSLVVTVFGDEKSVIDAIEAGARGYLLKDSTAEAVAASVLELQAGGSPISPAIARHLLARFQQESSRRLDDVPAPELSARETEVLELVVRGFTFPEIAKLLDLSSHTVKTYVRRIYRKLEVRSRGEAVFEAMQLGIVSIDDS